MTAENVTQNKPAVGSIYVDGDAQFYEVVKMTDKSITLRPIKSRQAGPEEGTAFLYSTPWLPCPGQYCKARINYEYIDRPFMRRLSGLSGYYAYAVTIDHFRGFAVPWDGEPQNSWTNLG